MLEKNQIVSASQTLHDHWRAGTKFAALDDWMRPGNRTEGYAIQAAIERYSTTHLFVLGPATTADWRSLDLVEERPVITMRGQQFIGHGKNVLGDPRIALTWLANELRQLGVTLKAGRVVTTGTCHAPLPIQAGDLFEADFGIFGKVSVALA